MISVIIPIYNKEKFLGKCIESVLNQTYKEIEIILINDGSTDESLKICESYKADKRIVIKDKKNEGASKTRNYGIKIARGDKILFIDADDYIEKNYIEKLVEYSEDLIICGYNTIDNEHIIKEKSFDFVLNNKIEIKNEFLKKDYMKLIVTPYLKLFKKDIIENNNILFYDNISFGEDTCFVFNYVLACNNLRFISNNGYNNVVCEGTLSRKYIPKLINQIDYLEKVITKFENDDNKALIDLWLFRNIKLLLYNEKNNSYRNFKDLIKKLNFNRINNISEFSKYDKIIKLLLDLKFYIILYIIYHYLRKE